MKKFEETVVRPEWRDIRYVQERFGVGVTTIYELIKADAIKSVLLRRPGKKQGKRLFSIKSIEEFFASVPNGMGQTPWSNGSEK